MLVQSLGLNIQSRNSNLFVNLVLNGYFRQEENYGHRMMEDCFLTERASSQGRVIYGCMHVENTR